MCPNVIVCEQRRPTVNKIVTSVFIAKFDQVMENANRELGFIIGLSRLNLNERV